MDGWPDALAHGTGCCRAALGAFDEGAEVAHVFDGDDDLDVHRLANAGVDDGDGPPVVVLTSAQESCGFFERALGSGQADSLGWCFVDRFESLEGERHVGTTFGAGQRVDLIDDHRFNPSQACSRLRRKHEVQRLRRGDQDVRWSLGDLATFLLRRVTGTDTDRRLLRGCAEPFSCEGDALDRPPQVLVDVDGQGTQR